MRWLIRHKSFYFYVVIYFILVSLTTLIFVCCVNIEDSVFVNMIKTNSSKLVVDIIANNTCNFLQYIILFIFSPLFVILDIFINVGAIVISVKNIGITLTIRHVIVHGMIEVPNILVYSYMSVRALKHFLLDKDYGIKEYVKGIWNHRTVYITCMVGIVVAGCIEGWLG